MSEAYLTLLPQRNGTADAATLRIDQAAERLRAVRAELEAVSPALTELEQRAAATAAALERALAQSASDRDTIARLQAELARRDDVRASVRGRVAELRRALGMS